MGLCEPAAHDGSSENNLSNPPLPPFSKGGYLFSPFEEGGLRGIIFMHLCEPQAHDGSSENTHPHPDPPLEGEGNSLSLRERVRVRVGILMSLCELQAHERTSLLGSKIREFAI